MGAYDRWELKLQKKTAPLLKEWSDMLLFCNYKNTIIEDSKTKSKKAVGGKRVMYTTHAPTYDAKNRFALPESLDMDFDQISHIFSGVPQKKSAVTVIKEKLEEAGITEERTIHYLRVQDPSLEGDSISDLDPRIIDYMAKNTDALIKNINKEDNNNE